MARSYVSSDNALTLSLELPPRPQQRSLREPPERLHDSIQYDGIRDLFRGEYHVGSGGLCLFWIARPVRLDEDDDSYRQ
jgi:hypothetical protein